MALFRMYDKSVCKHFSEIVTEVAQLSHHSHDFPPEPAPPAPAPAAHGARTGTAPPRRAVLARPPATPAALLPPCPAPGGAFPS
jgi:hypothetical protein